MNKKSKMSVKLIAPCGINCSVCFAHLREKNKCPGCRINDPKKPITRISCKIKTCINFKKGKAKFCFQCKKFPCDNLIHLDNRYKTKYNMSQIENLISIKENGISEFLINENKRWTCPKCFGTICVHNRNCINCGKKN